MKQDSNKDLKDLIKFIGLMKPYGLYSGEFELKTGERFKIQGDKLKKIEKDKPKNNLNEIKDSNLKE